MIPHKPSYKVNILSEKDYRDEMRSVVALTDACKETGEFSGKDNCILRYSIFRAEQATRNIIIVHGFTEFSEKYREIVWYFLEMGFNVFIYDHRSHGYSGRLIADAGITHVESFEDYVEDLTTFIREIVLPSGNGLPLDIFGHSMGGTVVLRFLIETDIRMHKAVLSSPMIVPYMSGHSPTIVKLAVQYKYAPESGWDAKFPHTDRFNPNAVFKNSSDMSKERFEYNLDLRRNDEHFQNSAVTNRWIYESLIQKKILLNKRNLSGIEVPVLLFSAGNDTTVRAKYHNVLKKRLKNCTFCCFSDAKHTIYTGTPEHLGRYYSVLFDFLSD